MSRFTRRGSADINSRTKVVSIARISGTAEHRWKMIEYIATRLDLDLEPDEIWLLVQLGRAEAPLRREDLYARFDISRDVLNAIFRRLYSRGLARKGEEGTIAATKAGRETYTRMVNAFRGRLTEAVERWSPEEHAEVRAMLTTFVRELMSALPRRVKRDIAT
jgi:hypothetical protein